jgi:hypothetical protein
MGRTVRARTQLTIAACVIGALLSACNGSDSDDGPTASGAAMLRPAYGLGPWGGRGSSSQSSSSSAPAHSSGSGGSSGSPGSVTLSWDPPTQNTNGTALTNLAGFYIYYGTRSNAYTNTIQIANPGVTTYIVDNLSPGTYYFVVTAYTAGGQDSAYSAQVSTTVN